jgi:4-diphosphocytidyl-2-C-methyl-D-erythritol kinase
VPDPDRGRRLAAPAKLNLWLRVVGRRDGYHELDTLMALLELADEVSTRPDGDGFEVLGSYAAEVPTGADNLAWRGWAAGWGSAGPDGGVTLDKTVPVAAGLGGGSSDAAAAWRLARHAVEGRDEAPDPATLGQLAAIGADVPFFAAGLPGARVGGIGERVAPAEIGPNRGEVVLVHPPFGLSTALVFGELKPADWSSGEGGPGPGRNDMLAPAVRLRPELADIFRLVARAGGEPHLSGSGPTIFVVSDDPERVDSVAVRVREAGLAATRTRLRSEPASIEAG